MVQRGEIHWVDLSGSTGSEQQRTRPCVILQNDVGNEHSPVTIVATCTSKSEAEYPIEVELPSSTEDVDEDSVVQLNQLRTVDINARLEGQIGEVSELKMREIEKALKVSLGLQSLPQE